MAALLLTTLATGGPRPLAASAALLLIPALGVTGGLRRRWARSSPPAHHHGAPIHTDRRSTRPQPTDRDALAHDLRGPLLTVRSYFDLLADDAFGALPPDARALVRRGAAVTAHAQAVLDHALTGAPPPPHSRQAGQAEGARGPADSAHPPAPPAGHPSGAAALSLNEALPLSEAVSLNEVLARVCDALAADIHATGARVDIGSLPEARGDATALSRVFSNLVENSLKYARPGQPPHIEISGHVQGEQCQLAVRDRGTGIAPEQAERVFGAAARATDAAPGRGLGLGIVRSIVEAHGGRVWADTAAEHGVCIRLTLPASMASADHTSASRAPQRPAA